MMMVQIMNDYIEETDTGYLVMSDDVPNAELVITGKICYDKQVPTSIKHACHLIYHAFNS